MSLMVDGLCRLLMSDEVNPVNLGNSNEFTVLELAHLVIRIVGGPSTIVFRPLPIDDPQVRQPDITLARERLGWAPTVRLAEGLAQTIDFFRQELGRMGHGSAHS